MKTESTGVLIPRILLSNKNFWKRNKIYFTKLSYYHCKYSNNLNEIGGLISFTSIQQLLYNNSDKTSELLEWILYNQFNLGG